ncbi:MAG: hypothetical protein J6X86_06290 [Bacteroidales bacterium]|nr:hypothetical protein [Bacteroidales bacterium]
MAVVAMFAACGGDKKGTDTTKKDSTKKENKESAKTNDNISQEDMASMMQMQNNSDDMEDWGDARDMEGMDMDAMDMSDMDIDF